LSVTNLRIAFPAGSLPLGGADEASALLLLEALFGLSDLPAYDAELFEEHAIRGMATLVRADYATACLVRESIARARKLRADAGLPTDLGFRREAVRVAGRVFESLAGCTVRGEGPLVDRLVREGAVRAEVSPASIVVTGGPDDVSAAAAVGPVSASPVDTVAFEFGSPVPTARYRFGRAELDALSRRAIAAAYPKDFRDRLKREAVESVRAVRARLAVDAGFSAAAALTAIQTGTADAQGEGRGRFESIAAATFLAGADGGRSRLVSDFLAEVAAFRKIAPARRAGGKG
jgi:hypothetical protein